jgi:hypothetical protein
MSTVATDGDHRGRHRTILLRISAFDDRVPTAESPIGSGRLGRRCLAGDRLLVPAEPAEHQPSRIAGLDRTSPVLVDVATHAVLAADDDAGV